MKIMISENIVFEAHFRNFLFHEKVFYILKIYIMIIFGKVTRYSVLRL